MEKEIIINGVRYVAIATTLPCQKEWEERKRLYAEGNKLYAEGNKLYAKGNKLRAEGDIQFYDAVIKCYGKDAIVTWIENNQCQIGEDIYK